MPQAVRLKSRVTHIEGDNEISINASLQYSTVGQSTLLRVKGIMC